MKKLYAVIAVAVLFLVFNITYIIDNANEVLAQVLQNTLSPGLTYYNSIEYRNKKSNAQNLRDFLIPAGGYALQNLEAVANVKGNNQGEAVEVVVEPVKQNSTQSQLETSTSEPAKTVYFKVAKQEEETKKAVAPVTSNRVVTGNMYSKLQLSNFSFLLGNYYTVTSITELNKSILKPEEFLNKDMTMEKKAGVPQILIFHTHSQEGFVDSREGDTSTTIVGVGDYLASVLHDRYGYEVYHDTTVYDLVDGKLDRSAAYTYAQENVEKILKQHPSIEVVIDLHRDGVDENTKLVTQVNGKPTAKIMFFNGLSYSKLNGDIAYLPNPNRDENLAMSLQMQLLGNAYYPGFLRRIYINSYRYVLHLRGKSTLVEAGAQTNTVAEVKNAMEPLADILDRLLKGEKGYTN